MYSTLLGRQPCLLVRLINILRPDPVHAILKLAPYYRNKLVIWQALEFRLLHLVQLSGLSRGGLGLLRAWKSNRLVDPQPVLQGTAAR